MGCGFVSAGGLLRTISSFFEALSDITLLSISNQNGAPSEIARAVIRNPNR
jgi:hypothetical protein